eukprot:TRINITY_DN354_c0_g1_i10.p1 TRINITY_DN354_c0_g1~~TRINITY_DN354_c0_g1_i10.p1  ORF type:complete len:291 (-),score=25.00 TRINITY_DN354_c0_g1_i10:539-1411(-)
MSSSSSSSGVPPAKGCGDCRVNCAACAPPAPRSGVCCRFRPNDDDASLLCKCEHPEAHHHRCGLSQDKVLQPHYLQDGRCPACGLDAGRHRVRVDVGGAPSALAHGEVAAGGAEEIVALCVHCGTLLLASGARRGPHADGPCNHYFENEDGAHGEEIVAVCVHCGTLLLASGARRGPHADGPCNHYFGLVPNAQASPKHRSAPTSSWLSSGPSACASAGASKPPSSTPKGATTMPSGWTLWSSFFNLFRPSSPRPPSSKSPVFGPLSGDASVREGLLKRRRVSHKMLAAE